MITSTVLRISGNVTYSDGSKSSLVAVYQDSLLIEPSSETSLEAFKQLWADKSSQLSALLNALGPTHTITTTAPSSNLTVNDWTFLFTGRITRSDQTSGDFLAEYTAKSGNIVSGGTVYVEAIADTATKAKIDALIEAVAGTNKVSIS